MSLDVFQSFLGGSCSSDRAGSKTFIRNSIIYLRSATRLEHTLFRLVLWKDRNWPWFLRYLDGRLDCGGLRSITWYDTYLILLLFGIFIPVISLLHLLGLDDWFSLINFAHHITIFPLEQLKKSLSFKHFVFFSVSTEQRQFLLLASSNPLFIALDFWEALHLVLLHYLILI